MRLVLFQRLTTRKRGGVPVHRGFVLASFFLLGLLPPLLRAQDAQEVPPPTTLKGLTIEQLLDIDVTSVSKRPEKLFDAASAIQVITADDIRRSGATSLPEALRLASNLEVAQIDSRQWAITARGFNNVFADKMLVLIDGRSVYTPLYAGVYWDVQDTFMPDLDRIEVISGPGATQWGGNAVNGVINITTKSAKDTQGGLVYGGTGSDPDASYGARYGGQLAPGLYYRVYAKGFNRDESILTNLKGANDAWRMFQGGYRLDWDRSTSDTLTLQGDLYSGSVDQPGPGDIHMNGLNTLGRWTRTLAANSDLQFQTYFDRTYRSIPGSFTQTLNTGDFDFQHRFPLGERHDIVWGVGYRVVADDIINTPANAFIPPKVTHDWVSAFAQDAIALSKDRLLLTLGSKFERNAYTGWEFQPSGRLAWTPDKQTTLWTAVSRAVRTPSRIDRDLYSPAKAPFVTAGSDSVISENLIAYELGARWEINPSLILSVAGYYDNYKNLRSLEPLNPPLPFPVQNSSGLIGHASGAEFTAEWRATAKWRLRAGYTEMRVHSEPEPGSPDRGTRGAIARDPNHQFTLRSAWDLSAKWEFDVDLRHVSEIGSQKLPGYTEADLRLGWTPAPTWDLALIGRNLLHPQHAEFNVSSGRREIPRTLFGQATWRF